MVIAAPLRPARSEVSADAMGVLAADLEASACMDKFALWSTGLTACGVVTLSCMISFFILPATRSSSLSSTMVGDVGAG